MPITQSELSYPVPWNLAIKIAGSVLTHKKRTFSIDARECVQKLLPSLVVKGETNIPQQGPCLLVMNHYSRPGLGAWWIALAISAVCPLEIHWVMTSAFTFNDRPLARPIVPLTRIVLQQVAKVYDFTPMPAMPPKPHEAAERARAVRRVLTYARKAIAPVIGLSPEGRDFAGGVLGMPTAGVGRFIAKLYPYCERILPVGVYEEQNRLCLSFGDPIPLPELSPIRVDDFDLRISRMVMLAIAAQLPVALRGIF